MIDYTYKQGNSYDCCHRFYGAPEYPLLIDPDETSYRAVDKYLFAETTEILANAVIVDKEVRERQVEAEKLARWFLTIHYSMQHLSGCTSSAPTQQTDS